MKLESELQQLRDEGVIDDSTFNRIKDYYASRKGNSGNRQIMVFGILGSLLAGLGIILIVAHNWDHFAKGLKLFFSFLPLAIGQFICAYTLLKRSQDQAWREGSSIFLIFSIGAAIALVSQIYQIQGSLESFLFTWSLLSLPLVYIMRSSMSNILYLIGITSYSISVGFDSSRVFPWNFLWLLALGIPHYVLLWKERPRSNFTYLHHWVIASSLTIMLPAFVKRPDELITLAYIFLFASFYLVGDKLFKAQRKIFSNPFLLIGSVGTVIVLLISSFKWIWTTIERSAFFESSSSTISFVSVAILLVVAIILWVKNELSEGKPGLRSSVFLIYLLIWLSSFLSDIIPTVLSNILLLLMSLKIIRRGLDDDHLGILNYGLLILSALVICRFFDSNMAFILRGVLFLLLGLSFFYFNYRLIKKRGSKLKEHE